MQEGNRETGTESEERLEAEEPEALPAEDQPRPSLAERLMSLDPTRGGGARERTPASPPPPSAPAAEGPPGPGSSGSTSAAAPTQERPTPQERPSASQADRRGWNSSVTRFSSAILEDALEESRRYIQVRYAVFLASVAVVFLLTVIVGIVFVGSLLGGSDWERIAISGAVATVSIILLLLLQYRPARSFGSAASQVAQLEATRAHLNKSFEFWDRYLGERRESHQLSANDVAMAVSSLTAASRELMNTEMDLEAGLARASENQDRESGSRRGSQGSQSAQGPGQRASQPPTSTMPDPRRY